MKIRSMQNAFFNEGMRGLDRFKRYGVAIVLVRTPPYAPPLG